MNERKPTWNCPVCDSKALYDTLLIDGYFQDILDSRQLPADENDVILERDGTWKPVPKEEEKPQDGDKKNGGGKAAAGNDDNVDFIDLSDDENEIPLPSRPPLPSGPPLPMSLPPLPPPPPQEIECIDLD